MQSDATKGNDGAGPNSDSGSAGMSCVRPQELRAFENFGLELWTSGLVGRNVELKHRHVLPMHASCGRGLQA